jgi:hypothetical protein
MKKEGRWWMDARRRYVIKRKCEEVKEGQLLLDFPRCRASEPKD